MISGLDTIVVCGLFQCHSICYLNQRQKQTNQKNDEDKDDFFLVSLCERDSEREETFLFVCFMFLGQTDPCLRAPVWRFLII